MKHLLALLLLLPVTHAAFAEEEITAEVTQIHRLQIRGDFGIRGGTDSQSQSIMPEYGLRVGVDAMMIPSFARLVPTAAYSYSSLDYGFLGAYDVTQYDLQILFKQVWDTGFYFGPTLGSMSFGASIFGITDTKAFFDYGVVAGYEFHRHACVSFGPEVAYSHVEGIGTFKATFGIAVNLL